MASDAAVLKKGDMLLTTGLHYQDQFAGQTALTYPVGFIQSVDHDTVRLRNLAHGIRDGMSLPLWMDYYMNERSLISGDIAAGSNQMIHVKGAFPNVGDRLDIPMLPPGTFVTAVDPHGIIRFSNSSRSERSYTGYTFVNGYPHIEMHSAYDPASLLKHRKTLIGGADFYLYDLMDRSIHDPAYLLGDGFSARYKNLNTHIAGDTSLYKLQYK
jgi:hypothetical protein